MANSQSSNHVAITKFSKSDFNFIHPFRMLVAGPSCSGKTTWVHSLILKSKELISPPIEKIYYVYDLWQPCFENIQNEVIFCHLNLDVLDMDNDKRENILIILDDLMEEMVLKKNQ